MQSFMSLQVFLHQGLTSRTDRQQALRVLVPALAMVQALGRSEPAALVAMRSLFLDLLPRLMHMPTEDGSVLQAAMGGDVVLFTHVQAAALAVSAPLLKLMLPLAASCLPVMMTTGGPAPLLALAYDVCRDSTTHGVVGPAAWHAHALVALVTNGVRAVLLSAADMEDEEAEELDACLELVAGLGPDLARWVAASGVANANVPAPCVVIFQTWVVCLQDSRLDGEGGDWSAATCARLFRAMERAVVGAGGSPAFLAAAITQCLSSIIAIAAASGSGSTEFFAGGAHDERQRPACAAALRVVRVLGAFPGFQTGVLLELLDLHAAANRKAKAHGPLVLHMLSAVHAGDTPALVLALSCLLKPESNAAVEMRLQVLAAMEQAVGARLRELAPDEGDQALELWPPEAVSTLSFSVLHDQAVTVRRSAMRLFSLVALPASRAAPLARLLVAKVRDADGVVSARAIDLMLQLPLPLLAGSLSLAEWADVLRYLLLRLTGTNPSDAPSSTAKGFTAPDPRFCRTVRSFVSCLIEAMVRAQPDGAGPAQIKPTVNQLLFAGSASLGALGGCSVHPVELLLSLGLDEGVLEGALVQLQHAVQSSHGAVGSKRPRMDSGALADGITQSGDWEAKCKGLLDFVARSLGRMKGIFWEAVDPRLLADYYTIIKNPMFFSQIESRLMRSKYESHMEFYRDVKLAFANCTLYNPKNDPCRKAGEKTEAEFDRVWVASGLAHPEMMEARGKRMTAGVAAPKYEPAALPSPSAGRVGRGKVGGRGGTEARSSRGDAPVSMARKHEMGELLQMEEMEEHMEALTALLPQSLLESADGDSLEIDFDTMDADTARKIDMFLRGIFGEPKCDHGAGAGDDDDGANDLMDDDEMEDMDMEDMDDDSDA
ncbi:hypothetical protein FOA52_008037 [Chlamydomonas sp. UWO 241]|nr:hypothetical protein FOA52_008037 [Chlamydomonas sp. UWO 241]